MQIPLKRLTAIEVLQQATPEHAAREHAADREASRARDGVGRAARDGVLRLYDLPHVPEAFTCAEAIHRNPAWEMLEFSPVSAIAGNKTEATYAQ